MTMFRWVLILLLMLLLLVGLFLRLRYGGGKTYPDISTDPRYHEVDLEVFYSHPEPIGNVAASKDTGDQTRVFFTIHPESRPETIKLLEIIDGKAVPYPNVSAQVEFETVLGLYVDNQKRLWTIDHGNHGFGDVSLTAFDLATNSRVHRYVFPSSVAERFSFFNDLSVHPNGRFVFVADVSFFGKEPSLVVYDMQLGKSKSLLDGHSSVSDQKFVPVTPQKKMRFVGGMVDLLTGIDGIDVSHDGKYIYYAAMGHSELFRIPVDVCTDFKMPPEEIANAVETVAKKPISDGIRTDTQGNVYITDVEHQGIYVIEPSGVGYTLIKDSRIRWADGLSLGGDGYFYLADSDIPNQMLRSKKNMAAHAPYHIFRFLPVPTE